MEPVHELLEDLQTRCMQQLKDGNWRLATDEERRAIREAFAEDDEAWAVEDQPLDYILKQFPLFYNLAGWLDYRLGFASTIPDIVATVALDILSKKEVSDAH